MIGRRAPNKTVGIVALLVIFSTLPLLAATIDEPIVVDRERVNKAVEQALKALQAKKEELTKDKIPPAAQVLFSAQPNEEVEKERNAYAIKWLRHQGFLIDYNQKTFNSNTIYSHVISWVIMILILGGFGLSALQIWRDKPTPEKITLKISIKDGIQMSGSVIGLFLFAISFVFFYLYLQYVYQFQIIGTTTAF
jgi:hypothetical protein